MASQVQEWKGLKSMPTRTISKVSPKQKKELARRQRVRAKLLLECPTDKRGFPLCPQCGKLPDLKDGRGELHLCHEISLARGGRTSYRNCHLACRACHNPDHGIRESSNTLRSYSGDRPAPFQLAGTHGTTGKSWSREQQAGIKK